MNTRQKMYETNGKARKWLRENGFVDIHLFPHTRYSKDIHFQGLSFDGCASLGKKLALFQIKTNDKPTKKVQAQMKLASNDSGVILIWISVFKKEIEVWDTNDNN